MLYCSLKSTLYIFICKRIRTGLKLDTKINANKVLTYLSLLKSSSMYHYQYGCFYECPIVFDIDYSDLWSLVFVKSYWRNMYSFYKSIKGRIISVPNRSVFHSLKEIVYILFCRYPNILN